MNDGDASLWTVDILKHRVNFSNKIVVYLHDDIWGTTGSGWFADQDGLTLFVVFTEHLNI